MRRRGTAFAAGDRSRVRARCHDGRCRHPGPGPDPRVDEPGGDPGDDRLHHLPAGYASSVRNVSTATKHQVYVSYNIAKAKQRLYVIDHLIPLEVGGANDIANLWPELKDEAHRKDLEENALHGDVCRGDLTLADAQRIAAGPVDAGLAAAVNAKGTAKKASDAAATQAEQLKQQQLAAYIAAVNQAKLADYLRALAAAKAEQERRQQQSGGGSSGGGSAGGGCNPNYTPCVPNDPVDVDCAGGGGNGPSYVTGPVRVIGSDPYRLDSDGDGVACEG